MKKSPNLNSVNPCLFVEGLGKHRDFPMILQQKPYLDQMTVDERNSLAIAQEWCCNYQLGSKQSLEFAETFKSKFSIFPWNQAKMLQFCSLKIAMYSRLGWWIFDFSKAVGQEGLGAYSEGKCGKYLKVMQTKVLYNKNSQNTPNIMLSWSSHSHCMYSNFSLLPTYLIRVRYQITAWAYMDANCKFG